MSSRIVKNGTGNAPPLEYCGKCVAWNADNSAIEASADTFEEIWRIARERNLFDPIFETIPRANVVLIGSL